MRAKCCGSCRRPAVRIGTPPGPYVVVHSASIRRASFEGYKRWYTSSAAWYMRAFVEGVLGIAAHLDGIHLFADLPIARDGFRLRRPYRRARYNITVRRARPGELPGLTVNGTRMAGSTLPYQAAGREVRVEGVVA